jgi:hypothetical protein
VVLRASGHPEMRATHAKSLELTGEAEITARATCVAGVRLAASRPAGLLRGPVSLTLEVGGHRAYGWGVINPAHAVTDRVVLRRAPSGGPETLVVRSTLTAAELDPALVERLREPGAEVTLTIAEEDQTPSGEARQALVLVGSRDAAPPEGRLAELWDHADLAVDLRRKAPGAAHAVRDLGVIAASLPAGGLLDGGPNPAVAELIALVSASHAVRVAAVHRDPVLEILLAAGLPPAPVQWLGRLGRAGARARQITPGPVPSVLAVPRQDAAAVLGRLAAAHPGHPVAVPDAGLDVGTAVDWITAADAPAAIAAHPAEAPLVVVAALGAGPAGDLWPIARSLIEAGVSPRTVGDALAPFGLDRRELYAGIPPKDQ